MSKYLRSLARRLSPTNIAVFPLSGTILLPGCDLPLNIFEPRYLNMIDDALSADRLIGIIQPAISALEIQGELKGTQGPKPFIPPLSPIGTLGRIKQYSETNDGRYLISLIGLKRFTLTGDAETTTPYRRAHVSYDAFKADPDAFMTVTLPQAMTESAAERARLITAMKIFAKTLAVEVDWKALAGVPINQLVDQCTMISPFGPADKQSLLEAQTPEQRRQLLIGLMTLYSRAAPKNHDGKDLQ